MPTGMTYHEEVLTGASNVVPVPFPYIAKGNVHVKVDDIEVSQSLLTWPTLASIKLPNSPAFYTGRKVRVERKSKLPQTEVVFTPNALSDKNLNTAHLQNLYLEQEGREAVDGAIADLLKARDQALAAADQASSVVGELVNRTFNTRTAAAAFTFPSAVLAVRTAGYSVIGDGGGALYKRASGEPAHAGKFQSADGQWWEIKEPLLLNSAHVGGVVADLAKTAYAIGASMFVKRGETANLVCNPTAGDNLQEMARWIGVNAILEETGLAQLMLADGFHAVNTYIDVTAGRTLRLVASGTPDVIQMTGVSFGSLGGNLYQVAVRLDSPLPARCVLEFPIGLQNCKGTSGECIGAINGGHKITDISADRLIVYFETRIYGAPPATAVLLSSLDNATTLGLLANRVLVPKSALLLNPNGWDGSAREGFLNATLGLSNIYLGSVGLAYQGITPKDGCLLFVAGGGNYLETYYAVLAGCGERSVRAGRLANIFLNYSMIGPGRTGADSIIAQGGGNITLVRCSVAGGSVAILGALDGSTITSTQSVLASGAQGLRTTYSSGRISFVNGRIHNCTSGVQLTYGTIEMDTLVKIESCASAITLSGRGEIRGNPTITYPVNATIRPYQFRNGGIWIPDGGVEPGFLPTVLASVTYPDVAAQAFSDSGVIAVPYARVGDKVNVVVNGTYPANNVDYKGYVSADDSVKVRKVNLGPTTAAGALVNLLVRVEPRAL